MINPATQQNAIEMILEAVKAGARCEKACELLELSVRTFRRWLQRLRDEQLQDQSKAAAALRTPANKLSDKERSKIVSTCNQPEYKSLAPTQIVPKLADKGIYLASCVKGSFYRLYLIEDIYSRKIVGWEVHENETAEHAGVLIRKACLSEGIHEEGLVLHSDNGSPMKGATMLATLQSLGIVPSLSRPSVSDDNPYSESLFRTLKYTPAYPSKPFTSLREARQWVNHFVHWYNDEHCHSGIQYVTSNQRHQGLDMALLAERKKVYEKAKKQNPARWSGPTRNWKPVMEVWLNPAKDLHAERSLNPKAA